jgi:hypothetical protein
MNMVFLTYMFYVKQRITPSITATVLFSVTFVTLFEAPLTTSHYSKGFQGTFTFFRGFLILIITGMYALAYREEIIPPRDHLPAFIGKKSGTNSNVDEEKKGAESAEVIN